MDLIIVDMLPYSIVEGDAFKRLNIADPLSTHRYKPKSEKYYRTALMPETYEKVCVKVKTMLQEATWISFTTDAWSNPTKSCSLLSLTAHFIKKNSRYKVILSAMVLEKDHDGSYLASKINEALDKWNIKNKIHIGIRDNAANLKLAMKIANIKDIGCVSHTLQLVIHDALFTEKCVEFIIKKARQIITHFKLTEQASRHLKEQQSITNSKEHALIQDIETRWNNTYCMLERLLEQRKSISMYAVVYGKIDIFSISEWNLIEKVVKLLKPFFNATQEICYDNSCISIVIPLIENIKDLLNISLIDNELNLMIDSICNSLNRRFSYINTSEPFLLATLLDPRFKDSYFNKEQREMAIQMLREFLKLSNNPTDINIYESAYNEFNNATTNIVKEDEISQELNADLWAIHDKKYENSSKKNNIFCDIVETPYEKQLQHYLTKNCLPRTKTDIYAYWNCS